MSLGKKRAVIRHMLFFDFRPEVADETRQALLDDLAASTAASSTFSGRDV
jgi:hypothetical protein